MKLKISMKSMILPAALAVVALVIWGVTSRGRGEKSEFRFVEITRGDLRSTVSSTGTLQAIKTVQVGTQVSGKVAEIYADFNDRVVEGQLIARIDPTLLEQAVSAAEADLERNQAELAQAQRDLDRIERLYQRQVATESEYTTAQYQHAVAQAGLKSSQVNLERARQNLGYSEIHAPISGIVLARTVDVGQTVAASFSAPQLFLIAEDPSQMEILAAVDESDIGQIRTDQAAQFTVQAYPDETFSGTVKQIRLQPSSQDNVVSYTVVISAANPDGRLLPGMTATVDFIIAQASDVLKVPNAALRFRATSEMLAAVREQHQGQTGLRGSRGRSPDSAETGGGSRGAPVVSGASERDRVRLWYVADGKVSVTLVHTGITDGQSTEITGSGIREGMQVIAAVASSATSSGVNPFQNQASPGGRPGPPPGM